MLQKPKRSSWKRMEYLAADGWNVFKGHYHNEFAIPQLSICLSKHLKPKHCVEGQKPFSVSEVYWKHQKRGKNNVCLHLWHRVQWFPKIQKKV